MWMTIKKVFTWLGKNTWAIIAAAFAVLLGLLKVERKKTEKAKAQTQQAQEEVEKVKKQQDMLTTVSNMKDELIKKQRENAVIRDEITHEIRNIPDENKEELSEEVKKLASDQFSRLHSHANKLSNN